jgi:hypothetical protein
MTSGLVQPAAKFSTPLSDAPNAQGQIGRIDQLGL